MQMLNTFQMSISFQPQTISLDIFSKYLQGFDLNHMPFKLYTPVENAKSKAKKGGVRGPYRKYTATQKVEIIQRMLNGESLKKIAQETLIPKRNLIRWKHQYLHKKEKNNKNESSDIEESLELQRTQHSPKRQILETKENLSQQLIQAAKLYIC